MNRKVLIICSSYYPNNQPGSHRVGSMSKYLPEFGWYPIVLCPDWTPHNTVFYDATLTGKNSCETLRVPYLVDCRSHLWLVFDRLNNLLLPGFTPRRLLRNMESCAQTLVKSNMFDLIVAESPSSMCLTIASRISGQSGIPWIADLRDIPDEHGTPNLLVRRHVGFQTSICRTASALVTVSLPLAERLASRSSVPIHVVYNGYDTNDFAVDRMPKPETFNITYCGRFYYRRSHELLLDALDRIIAEDQYDLGRVRINFHVSDREYSKVVSNHLCSNLVRHKGFVSHCESISAQQQATVLLLLSYANGVGIMTSKVFEYLGARRPILSIPGDHSVTDALLEKTQAGRIGRTSKEIAAILIEWLAQWETDGRLRYAGRSDVIEQYTRRNQVARMAQVMGEIVQAKTRK